MTAWEKLAENRIQEAIDSGEFVAPLGGAALDLSGYFALPPTDRVGISILRNAGVLPPEVEMLKQMARLEHELGHAEPARARELNATFEALRVSFRMAMERRARAARDA